MGQAQQADLTKAEQGYAGPAPCQAYGLTQPGELDEELRAHSAPLTGSEVQREDLVPDWKDSPALEF